MARVSPFSGSYSRVSWTTVPPSSSSAICRRASNSIACSMKRKELRFLISQRVPSFVAPDLRTDTLASQRNDPSCMLPSQMPIQRTSACSARA